MNLVERIMYLYIWKEELANKIGKNITEDEITMFKDFSWWFEAVSFDRIKPDINDLVSWEGKFAELENGSSK